MKTLCMGSRIHIGNCKSCWKQLVKAVNRMNAANAGSVRTEKKAKSSRENGKLGGRPRKTV